MKLAEHRGSWRHATQLMLAHGKRAAAARRKHMHPPPAFKNPHAHAALEEPAARGNPEVAEHSVAILTSPASTSGNGLPPQTPPPSRPFAFALAASLSAPSSLLEAANGRSGSRRRDRRRRGPAVVYSLPF